MNNMKSFVWFLLWTLIEYATGTSKPCVLRGYGDDNWVCVCNSSYCDTIERITTIDENTYVCLESTKSGLRFDKTTGYFSDSCSSTEVLFIVNCSITYQELLGFGAAFTDAAGINLLSLSKEAQNNLLRSYFSVDGSEYSLGRVPIGGTDFSLNAYSLDDSEEPDPELENFSLTTEDYTYKIPVILSAMKMSDRDITLVAASWSPPNWMKSNDAVTGFSYLKPEYYETYAIYHIRFLDEYIKNNVKISILSTQNEPMDGVIPVVSFNSLGWIPSSMADWIVNYLGPKIQSSEHNDTIIVTFDDQRFYLTWWIDTLFSANANVAEYINGFAVHWYTDFFVGVGCIEELHEKHPEMMILYTESCTGYLPLQEDVIIGSWDRGELYLKSIIENVNAWVTGWIDWNLCLNLTGGPNWNNNFVDSPILVNATADEFYKQPMYYAIGHVSKFIDKYARRIYIAENSSSSSILDTLLDFIVDPFSGIYAMAAQNTDKSIVIVILNENDEDKEISIYIIDKGYINITVKKHSYTTLLCSKNIVQ